MKRTIITYEKCSACGKTICKRKAEINRQIRNGRTKFYCNISCAGKDSCQHLKQYNGDEYSDFRWYIKMTKQRTKRTHNLTCEYLKRLWEKQKGICPITGKHLRLRTNSNKADGPYDASLDRIDNTKGYIKGNVRFVALIFNYARNTFSDNEVIDFCKAVIEHN